MSKQPKSAEQMQEAHRQNREIKRTQALLEKDRKNSKVIYFFIGFFTIFISVNIFYIYLSKKTWRGVVTEGSYRKGVEYNDVLKEAEKQEKLGWRVDISSRRYNEKKVVINVRAADDKNRQLKDAKIFIEFKRPTQEGYDFFHNIPYVDGVFSNIIEFPMKGQWDFHIRVLRGQDSYKETKRFVIK